MQLSYSHCFFVHLQVYYPIAQLCEQKKKKCGTHTHVHHLSRLSFLIFTSVVVYSRTIAVYSRTTNTIGLNISFFNIAPILFNNIRKILSELSKRNVDHVFIRFAWMLFCLTNVTTSFRLIFFFAKMFFELNKKNVDHVVMRFAR